MRMNATLFFLQNLGITLLLGGLVGLEREQMRGPKGASYFGGIRTMALVSTFSYLALYIFQDYMWLFGLITGGFLLMLVASYLASAFVYKSLGATTEMGVLFVYLIGVLMAMELRLEAVIVTLMVIGLLHFKEALHKFAYAVEREELYTTLKFIAVAFVVLPLLPNETFGPLDVLNPYLIWLMVVFVSSISFASYIAVKLLGARRGIGLSGFLGGLVSSTAVTLTLSALSKKSSKLFGPFVFGILIASSSMFFRVLFQVSVLAPAMLPWLWAPLLSMGILGFGLAFAHLFSKKGEKAAYKTPDFELKSPFQLLSAIKFGLFFGALLFFSKWALAFFGEEGVYLTALLSGFVDVDAITISLANLSAQGALPANSAAMGVVLATASNTLVKAGMTFLFASKAVGRRVLFSMLFMLLIGMLSTLIFIPQVYGLIAF